ncbi:hypothetical protein Tco_0077549 [Tanacetum coccineum]
MKPLSESSAVFPDKFLHLQWSNDMPELRVRLLDEVDLEFLQVEPMKTRQVPEILQSGTFPLPVVSIVVVAYCPGLPDYEDSQFCHSSKVSHPQLHLGIDIRILSTITRVDIKKKTENQSKMTRTEHGMEKTVLKQGQSPKIAKSVNKKISRSKRGAGTEDTIECNLNPSDGGPRESQ